MLWSLWASVKPTDQTRSKVSHDYETVSFGTQWGTLQATQPSFGPTWCSPAGMLLALGSPLAATARNWKLLLGAAPGERACPAP